MEFETWTTSKSYDPYIVSPNVRILELENQLKNRDETIVRLETQLNKLKNQDPRELAIKERTKYKSSKKWFLDKITEMRECNHQLQSKCHEIKQQVQEMENKHQDLKKQLQIAEKKLIDSKTLNEQLRDHLRVYKGKPRKYKHKTIGRKSPS